jgi:hypothetical protein
LVASIVITKELVLSCPKVGVHESNWEEAGIVNSNTRKESKDLFIANNLMCKLNTIFRISINQGQTILKKIKGQHCCRMVLPMRF